MIKLKNIARGIILIVATIPIFVMAQTPATININPYIPGATIPTNAGPCGWIVNFYTFALIVSGILAFGAIVYGGFKYATSAGNASKQAEGRSWIWSALIGLLLLAGAYIILNTINPALTSCQISLSGIPTGTSGGGGTTPSQPTQPSKPSQPTSTNQACQTLTNAGVNVSCSKLNGVQSSTIDALVDLKKECPGDSVGVTSVTGGAHSVKGGCTHSNGYKADISPNSALNSCITGSSNGFTPDGTRKDGAPLYLAPDGAIYADERTKPSNCGSSCDWTAAHWDIQACGVK